VTRKLRASLPGWLATTPTIPALAQTSAAAAPQATLDGGVATRPIAWGHPPSAREKCRGDNAEATTAGAAATPSAIDRRRWEHGRPPHVPPLSLIVAATCPSARPCGGHGRHGRRARLAHRRRCRRRLRWRRCDFLRLRSRRQPVVGPTGASAVAIKPHGRDLRRSKERALSAQVSWRQSTTRRRRRRRNPHRASTAATRWPPVGSLAVGGALAWPPRRPEMFSRRVWHSQPRWGQRVAFHLWWYGGKKRGGSMVH